MRTFCVSKNATQTAVPRWASSSLSRGKAFAPCRLLALAIGTDYKRLTALLPFPLGTAGAEGTGVQLVEETISRNSVNHLFAKMRTTLSGDAVVSRKMRPNDTPDALPTAQGNSSRRLPPIPLACSAAAADGWLVTARKKYPMRKARTTANLRNYPGEGELEVFFDTFSTADSGNPCRALVIAMPAVRRCLCLRSSRNLWLFVHHPDIWRQVFASCVVGAFFLPKIISSLLLLLLSSSLYLTRLHSLASWLHLLSALEYRSTYTKRRSSAMSSCSGTHDCKKLIFSQVMPPSITLATPAVSMTCVHSIPSSSTLSLQNTFSSDSISSFGSDSCSSSSDLVHKYSSPSLRSALFSKKCSLYKARKSSSKDLLSLISPPQTSSLQISQSCHCNRFHPAAEETSSNFSETTFASSYPSSFISDVDNNSLYSNPVSTTISTIYEVDDDSHPLGDFLEDETLAEVFDIRSNDANGHRNEYKIDKVSFTSLWDKLVSSSFITSTKLFYQSNESFFTNAVNNINIENRDLVLHDLLPLETFHTAYKAIDERHDRNNIIVPRSRECRINPLFLRFFAINESIKKNCSSELLDGSTVDYHQYEFINSGCSSLDEYLSSFNFEEKTTTLKFQLLSRDKMWSEVVLPPRSDISYNKNYKSFRDPYVKVKNKPIENGSLVRENGKVMPWLNLNDCAMQNKRCFSPSGTLPGNIQYTVKNWEKKRWSPTSL